MYRLSRLSVLAAGALLGLAMSVAAYAVETRVVMVPTIVVVDGVPRIIMRPVIQIIPDPAPPGLLPGLPSVTKVAWTETAVRKVLHIFAYGGHATDTQITAWADMIPSDAIAEMLTFDEHNLKLSAPVSADQDDMENRPGTLRALSDFWSSNNGANRVLEEDRDEYEVGEWEGPERTWLLATTIRGLNPFRQKIGLFETNYHMAVNQEAGVSTYQMMKYYDDIMESLEEGVPYQDTIAAAAASAAVARQYDHNENRWQNGQCFCNEDFAREYHQLFFRILGVDDPTEHEEVNIPNTAKMLTDMPLSNLEAPRDWEGAYVDFGTDVHHGPPLAILDATIEGVTALEKIFDLAQVAIEHPESLEDLPVEIVRVLADDNLDAAKKDGLRRAWASMDQKDLLRFLRAYAISTLFHDGERHKFLTSIDRHMLTANLTGLTNEEQYVDHWESFRLRWDEGVRPFFPLKDVFGHQSGEEAANSANLFRLHYNSATGSSRRFYSETTSDHGREVTRDWGRIAPNSASGEYVVSEVAAWLWQRLLADGLKHFGPLERAQVYALLARGNNVSNVAFDEIRSLHPDRGVPVTEEELATPDWRNFVTNLGAQTMNLGSANGNDRGNANENMGQAVAFIVATPYFFVQEGR